MIPFYTTMYSNFKTTHIHVQIFSCLTITIDKLQIIVDTRNSDLFKSEKLRFYLDSSYSHFVVSHASKPKKAKKYAMFLYLGS